MLPLVFLLFSVSSAQNADQFIAANNQFAPSIYKELIKTSTGNIIVSPFSAEIVLALLETGTKGASSQQLKTALNLPNCDVETSAKSLISQFQNLSYVQLANKIYIQENYPIREDFTDVATNDFFAATQLVDFGQSAQVADDINQWVEEKTNNSIQNLISPSDLNAKTRVVLVNALHFKEQWALVFQKGQTSKASFTKLDGSVVQVDTLHQNRKNYNYYSNPSVGVEFLELFFKEREASFIIGLPAKSAGLQAVENRLGEIDVTSLAFQSKLANVALPKFKFDNTIDFESLLQQLNVSDIFRAGQADLTGIGGEKGDLYVTKILQKAIIELNEDGVEAAAATAIAVGTSAIIASPNPINFIVDRPFLFWLQVKGVVIFQGRVVDPQ